MAGAATLVKRFRELYPASADPHIWRAPGRVNLIGEHTDYNLGLVLPVAIDLECCVATSPSNDGWLRVYSEQLAQGAQWRVEGLAHVTPRGDWSDRVVGVAWELARRGEPIAPQNILVTSTVPFGGGLSSSAALGVSLALALGGERDRTELTQLARAAETDFVGVPCGIMDQFVSANGQAGAAILLDCRSLAWRAVQLPEGLAIVAANSMVRHELAGPAYRTRVEECTAAARIISVASLREATYSDLGALDGDLLKRARHVISENGRVEAFASAAERGDLDEMGKLTTESHRSLRDDYEVSCPELDFLVETALRVPGVFGARMTGGGFGGSTVNLVHNDAVPELASALTREYQQFWGVTPQLHVCRPSDGASQLF
jgi:galactokinase